MLLLLSCLDFSFIERVDDKSTMPVMREPTIDTTT
jgi:hypothetical protein